MSQENQNSKHRAFLDLGEALRARAAESDNLELAPAEVQTLLDHHSWLVDYIKVQQEKRARVKEKTGPKPKSEKEIKPESLRRRERRAAGKS